MNEIQPTLYAGLSNITYNGEPFDFGYGVELRSAYAHLFSYPMMAFGRAERGKPHPAPWHAALGGVSYDIEAEIAVPIINDLPGALTSEDTVWLIAALLRLAEYAYLMVPVFSSHAFDKAAISLQKPLLRPFETEGRILTVSDLPPETSLVVM